MNKKNQLLRWSAMFEGTSFLLLVFVAMPMKYWAEVEMAVRIVAPIHGVLFLAYIAILLITYLKKDIKQDIKIIKLGILASVIPFGTFFYTAKMLNSDEK